LTPPAESVTVPVYTPGCRPEGENAMLTTAGVEALSGVAESQFPPEFVAVCTVKTAGTPPAEVTRTVSAPGGKWATRYVILTSGRSTVSGAPCTVITNVLTASSVQFWSNGLVAR